MSLSNKVIEEFRKLCDWAYVSWSMRKSLFDENPDSKYLKNPRYSGVIEHLSAIMQEHWLLQLAKLHDPAIQSKATNLSIAYIIEYGCWDSNTDNELKRLQKEMEQFYRPNQQNKENKQIETARNKILSHNDLTSILAGDDLGTFQAGDDIKYFKCLQDFVNLIYEKTIGGSYLFYDNTPQDVEVFMHCFKKGSNLIDG